MNIEFLSTAYHSKCIDPWLTRNRRVCPVCKRKVFAEGEQVTDTESESDADDTSPLIRPRSYGTQGGTFVPQRVCMVHVKRTHLCRLI
jgi:E3 ubiquitin-protein ligase RNF13